MTKEKENMLYRITAQTNGVTITAHTTCISEEEAHQAAVGSVLMQDTSNYNPYVLTPLATQKEWDEGVINFCLRCGARQEDHDHYDWARFECSECDADVSVNIHSVPKGDEDDE